MKLRIARGYAIDLNAPPFDTMGLRAFISGMSGAGKSYTQMKFIEEAFAGKLQFCLLDVHGEGHVLGELGDKVMVVSDRFGIPVVKEAIPIYLEALENGMSVVIDLKPMFYDDEELFFSFLETFLNKFMSLWSKVMTPILLCFDEAQEIMPQSPPKGIRGLYKTVKKIVLGGRKSGVHYLLASQRPALIDKTPISQANVRLFGKIEGQADWDAIKQHVKPFSFDDMKRLRSGEFILSTEGKSTRIKILSRKTTDAGATPTFKPKFTAVQKVKMEDISKRIQELIAKAQEEAEKAEQEGTLLKRLERQLASSKQREQELKAQLSTIELIAEKIGGNTSSSKTVDATEVYAEVRAEFNKELGELRKRHKRLIDQKEKELADIQTKLANLDRNLEQVVTLRESLRDFIGTQGTQGVSAIPNDIVQRVTAEVLKKIPVGGSTTYQVAPQKAIRKDWQKKALEEIMQAIDELNPKQIKIVTYLLATEEPYSRTSLAIRLFGTRKGGVYSEFKRNIDALILGHFLHEEAQQVQAALGGLALYYVGDLHDDEEYLEIVPHIEAHLHSKGGGGNG